MLDTLKYAKRLETAGIPRKQAEAHAEALRDALAEDRSATKRDVRSTETTITDANHELRDYFRETRQKIRAELQRFGHMYIAHGGTIVILFVLLKFFD